jgi:hypothetical protein
VYLTGSVNRYILSINASEVHWLLKGGQAPVWNNTVITLDQAVRYFENQSVSKDWTVEFENALTFVRNPENKKVLGKLRTSSDFLARLQLIIDEMPRLSRKMSEADLRNLLRHFSVHAATSINSVIIIAEDNSEDPR